MKQKFKIAVCGNGRISRAILHYFNKYNSEYKPFPLAKEKELLQADLLVGALAGEIGERCLDLAIKYGKPLVDVSDVDPEVYQAREKDIVARGITVVPGCGFCPGLVNFVLGREASCGGGIREIHVKAGSLSPKKNYFPFLWCFEDLVLEHRLVSKQVISGKKKQFPAFAGYRPESYFGIAAESYYSASGFENILDKTGARSLTCRVVRPRGFMDFFRFMDNHGVLDAANLAAAKAVLEGRKEDNYTLGEVELVSGDKSIIWLLKSFSHAAEKMNSMQKMTAVVPVVIGGLLLNGSIKGKGILFMEELARDAQVFAAVISGVKKEGVILTRNSH